MVDMFLTWQRSSLVCWLIFNGFVIQGGTDWRGRAYWSRFSQYWNTIYKDRSFLSLFCGTNTRRCNADFRNNPHTGKATYATAHVHIDLILYNNQHFIVKRTSVFSNQPKVLWSKQTFHKIKIQWKCGVHTKYLKVAKKGL